jgi:hypothetical protein
MAPNNSAVRNFVLKAAHKLLGRQFVSLRDLDSFDRWLAISERRPMTMNWLVCWARSAIP